MFEQPYDVRPRPLLAYGIAALFFAPIAWLLFCALRVDASFVSARLLDLAKLSLSDTLARLWHDPTLLRAVSNSAVIASVSALIAVVAGTFCALIIAVPLRRLLTHTTALIVGLRFVPPVVLVPFYYLALVASGLIDTLGGLILVHAIVGTALAAICLVPGFLAVRDADIQQAKLEGAAFFPQILFSVILPRIRGSLAVAWCFAFMASWNELLLMSFLAETRSSQGIAVYCLSAIGQFRIDFKGLCLGGALSLVPCIAGIIAFSWLLRRFSSLGLRASSGS